MILLIILVPAAAIIGGAMIVAAIDVNREMKYKLLMNRKDSLKNKRISARVRRCIEADLIINSIKEYEN